MRVLPFVLLFTVAGGAWAQQQQPQRQLQHQQQPQRQLQHQQQRATAVRIETSPDRPAPPVQWTQRAGRSNPALPPDPGIVKQTEVVPRDLSVHQYLDRKGIVPDRRTVEAFKTLNPETTADNRIPANTPVTVFVPEVAAERTAVPPRARVDMGQVASYTAAVEVDRASRVKAAAMELPPSAYRRPADMGQHRELLARVDDTARLVEKRAAALPSRDLALSRYYLANASATAQSLNAQARERPIGSEELQRLESATRPVQAMQARLARGDSAFERRKVTVTVHDKDGRHLREPLRVYVLPAGLVDNPSQPGLIRELLSELTFERLTSPATGMVLGGDMRIWVGPDYQYDQMAQLVLQRRLTRYAPVHGHLAGEPDPNLLFPGPDSITVPGR